MTVITASPGVPLRLSVTHTLLKAIAGPNRQSEIGVRATCQCFNDITQARVQRPQELRRNATLIFVEDCNKKNVPRTTRTYDTRGKKREINALVDGEQMMQSASGYRCKKHLQDGWYDL